MSKIFHLQIVTPDKVFFDGQIVSLIVPGDVGYLGVLADHAPLISTLKPGTIQVRATADSQPVVLRSPGKGFIEVIKNQVTLLLRTIER